MVLGAVGMLHKPVLHCECDHAVPALAQMPHFLALAWLCREDYARGGYRMLSLMDISGRRTAACALRNSLYLLPAGCLATYLGVTTVAFITEAAIMTGATPVQVGDAALRLQPAPCPHVSSAITGLYYRACVSAFGRDKICKLCL